MVHMGKLTRVNFPICTIQLRYLFLPCPICMKPILVAPLLSVHIATSDVIKNLVDEWIKMLKLRKMRGRPTTVILRSICTQTDLQDVSGVPDALAAPALHDLNEEFYTRKHNEDLSRITGVTDSSEGSTDHKSEPAAVPDVTSSASSLAFSSDHLIEHSIVVRHQRSHCFLKRRVLLMLMLMSIWCIYCIVMVGVAQPMLTCMIVFTLFFLVIFFFFGEKRGKGGEKS